MPLLNLICCPAIIIHFYYVTVITFICFKRPIADVWYEFGTNVHFKLKMESKFRITSQHRALCVSAFFRRLCCLENFMFPPPGSFINTLWLKP